MREKPDQERPLAPRGGNSAMSIPPGADLDANYATDDWAPEIDPEEIEETTEPPRKQ